MRDDIPTFPRHRPHRPVSRSDCFYYLVMAARFAMSAVGVSKGVIEYQNNFRIEIDQVSVALFEGNELRWRMPIGEAAAIVVQGDG